MGLTSELRGALGLQGACKVLKVLQRSAEGGAQPSTSLSPLTGRPGRARHPGRRRCPWLSAQGAAAKRGGAAPVGAGAWYYKRRPGHLGNELPARLSSRTLATCAPCSLGPAKHSAAAAMVSAWCSIALALLLALHEGELPSLEGCDPRVYSLVSPPGAWCFLPKISWGHRAGSPQ